MSKYNHFLFLQIFSIEGCTWTTSYKYGKQNWPANVQNGDILLKKVFVPDADRLPGVNSFQDTKTA